ncbi:hypothetical protein CDIK_3468, partial [Cucumispora dikerogammari]
MPLSFKNTVYLIQRLVFDIKTINLYVHRFDCNQQSTHFRDESFQKENGFEKIIKRLETSCYLDKHKQETYALNPDCIRENKPTLEQHDIFGASPPEDMSCGYYREKNIELLPEETEKQTNISSNELLLDPLIYFGNNTQVYTDDFTIIKAEHESDLNNQTRINLYPLNLNKYSDQYEQSNSLRQRNIWNMPYETRQSIWKPHTTINTDRPHVTDNQTQISSYAQNTYESTEQCGQSGFMEYNGLLKSSNAFHQQTGNQFNTTNTEHDTYFDNQTQIISHTQETQVYPRHCLSDNFLEYKDLSNNSNNLHWTTGNQINTTNTGQAPGFYNHIQINPYSQNIQKSSGHCREKDFQPHDDFHNNTYQLQEPTGDQFHEHLGSSSYLSHDNCCLCYNCKNGIQYKPYTHQRDTESQVYLYEKHNIKAGTKRKSCDFDQNNYVNIIKVSKLDNINESKYSYDQHDSALCSSLNFNMSHYSPPESNTDWKWETGHFNQDNALQSNTYQQNSERDNQNQQDIISTTSFDRPLSPKNHLIFSNKFTLINEVSSVVDKYVPNAKQTHKNIKTKLSIGKYLKNIRAVFISSPIASESDNPEKNQSKTIIMNFSRIKTEQEKKRLLI